MWRITDEVESWSWEGCEGKKASVTVYSDAAKAELFVNGKSAGKKKTKKDIAKFKKIPYEARKIEAVTYDSSGKETGRTSLISATGKTLIKLTPEEPVSAQMVRISASLISILSGKTESQNLLSTRI